MAVNGRTAIFPHRIDKSTDANAGIDYEHKEVHSGDAYYRTDVASDIDAAVATGYVIQTPNTTTWAHLLWTIEGRGLITIELYEGVTVAIEDNATIRNRNRNFPDSPELIMSELLATVDTGGTLIYEWTSGSATPVTGRNPGISRNTGEIVLKQNTKYGLKVTSGVNDNVISFYLTWYEHANIE